MIYRKYRPSDCQAVVRLFYETVHTVCRRDYSPAQLDAWAPETMDTAAWNDSLLAHDTLVAEEEGCIAGFGDIDRTGYLDRLYVHRDFQRRGIASALCGRLEQAAAAAEIVTHASLTARGFFEKRGYRTEKEQQVERRGVLLTNFVMILKR